MLSPSATRAGDPGAKPRVTLSSSSMVTVTGPPTKLTGEGGRCPDATRRVKVSSPSTRVSWAVCNKSVSGLPPVMERRTAW